MEKNTIIISTLAHKKGTTKGERQLVYVTFKAECDADPDILDLAAMILTIIPTAFMELV